MKKIHVGIFAFLVILVVLVGIYALNINSGKEPEEVKYETFSLDEYSNMILNCPSDKKVGSTLSATDAKEKAKKVWLELYEKERVEKSLPACQVEFDPQNEVWLVHFVPSFPDVSAVVIYRGQGLGILIQKADGKVLAVWGT